MNRRYIVITALLLAAFALLGVSVLALMHQFTAPVIAEQARDALNRQLAAVLPPGFDNDPASTAQDLPADPRLGGAGAVLYRANQAGKTSGWALRVVAPNGYSGAIHLLVGVSVTGEISGVRVLTHKETPGLGDPIELEKSPWILSFNGKSLLGLPPKGWAVKKDGGVFDQFTGATITPRAVVQAVHHALEYVAEHQAEWLGESK
ncbi:MAG: electron transport complex subunit RsxG [Pseudomonadota bacterium]